EASRETTRRTLLSGTAKASLAAAIDSLDDGTREKVTGVSFEARFNDDAMQQSELNDILRTLSDMTGRSLPPFPSVDGENREIKARLSVDEATLMSLTVDPRALSKNANRAGVD